MLISPIPWDFLSALSVTGNSSFALSTADVDSRGYDTGYFKFYNNSSDIPMMEEIINHDNTSSTAGASTNGGYANYEAYLLDEITDPFEITSVSDIRVYAVPRIPANMNADGSVNDLVECYADGCPVSVDIDADPHRHKCIRMDRFSRRWIGCRCSRKHFYKTAPLP